MVVYGFTWAHAIGDGVGLQVGTLQEGHGEDLLQREVVVGEPQPMADKQAFLGHLHLMTRHSHRLAKLLHSPVCIHFSLRCGLPPHVPTTTTAHHPACQEPHILAPLCGGVLVNEDLPDEAVVGPWHRAHANWTVDGTCCYCWTPAAT